MCAAYPLVSPIADYTLVTEPCEGVLKFQCKDVFTSLNKVEDITSCEV